MLAIKLFQDLQRKAVKLVAAKAACHESIEGHIGQLLHDEIEKKLDEYSKETIGKAGIGHIRLP